MFPSVAMEPAILPHSRLGKLAPYVGNENVVSNCYFIDKVTLKVVTGEGRIGLWEGNNFFWGF